MWGALMLKPCSATRMGASTSASRWCAGITNASRGHTCIASKMRDLRTRKGMRQETVSVQLQAREV